MEMACEEMRLKENVNWEKLRHMLILGILENIVQDHRRGWINPYLQFIIL